MSLENLRKSFLTLFLLKLLHEHGTMYGYQMCKVAKSHPTEPMDLKFGTLYPLLSSLEERGIVKSEIHESPRGPYRKYYSLTEKGQNVFREEESTLARFCRVMGYKLMPEASHA